jgi:protein SCO1/2
VRARLGGLAGVLVACVAFAQPATALDPDRALAASRAAIGSQPDAGIRFTTAQGTNVTLGDFRGKPLVVSFVYTGCSQVCPTTTRFLARAVREARAVVGAEAFHVASIGFNIPADNPMSMRVFARSHGIEDARWALLVPEPGAPERLAAGFGFAYEAAAGGYEHLTQVTVLDAEGRVAAQIHGEAFDLPMLVQPLRALALGEKVPTATLSAVVERVRLLCTVYDPASGRYRLDYALFIELGVGIAVLGLTLGFLLRERRRARRPC